MEQNFAEQHEHLSAYTKTLTGDELIKIVYQGASLPQDSRFLPIDEGGVFKYLYLPDLIRYNGTKDIYFPVVEVEGQIVGMAKLEKANNNPDLFWIQFVSVDPKFQNHGYASKLLEEIFRFAKQEQCKLQSSMYSKLGYTKLKPKLNELSKKYSVELIDTEDRTGS